jgi:hypothetical protein
MIPMTNTLGQIVWWSGCVCWTTIEAIIYLNLSLRLTTKARACEGVGQEWSSGVTFHAPESVRKCEGMNRHTPKWAPTLGVGVQMDSWIFNEQLQGSKPIGLRSSLYHQKDLGTYMSKMGLHDPFGHFKHKLWLKKGRESNWQIDSQPLKVMNRPDFLMWRWRATYHWKSLNKACNFSLDLISIRVLDTKLWAPKVARVLTLGILGLPLWESWDKMTFGCWSRGQAQNIL